MRKLLLEGFIMQITRFFSRIFSQQRSKKTTFFLFWMTAKMNESFMEKEDCDDDEWSERKRKKFSYSMNIRLFKDPRFSSHSFVAMAKA